ncbi:MAG: hypothetical protein U0930_03045 [Pirellulales bacterium]
MNNASKKRLLGWCLFVLAGQIGSSTCIAVDGNGLHDVEIIEPGNYVVQQAQLPQPFTVSCSLASRIKLPGQVAVYPLAENSSATLSAHNCPTHVHNFYYSGKSDFQCPIIKGGRTRIVTVHPATGEPVEFFVMLAAGAPRVEYCKKHFAYVYQDHRTEVAFPSIGPYMPRVVSRQINGKSLSQRWDAVEKRFTEAGDNLNKTNTVQAMKELADDEKRQFAGLGVLIDRGVGGTIKATKSISSLIPGKQALRSLQEQRPEDMRDAEALQAQRDTISQRTFIKAPE